MHKTFFFLLFFSRHANAKSSPWGRATSLPTRKSLHDAQAKTRENTTQAELNSKTAPRNTENKRKGGQQKHLDSSHKPNSVRGYWVRKSSKTHRKMGKNQVSGRNWVFTLMFIGTVRCVVKPHLWSIGAPLRQIAILTRLKSNLQWKWQ